MQGNQNQTHWAYIAGVMDSDGCFMIMKHKRKTKNGTTERALEFPKTVENWAITYLPALKISQIEPEAIDFIMNEMGFGKMNIDGVRKDRPNSKPIYHWRIRNPREAIPFIEGVMPYLRIKINRAKHLLEFSKHLASYSNPCYKGLSIDELNYREDMYLKMREFNGNKVGATTKSQGHESACDSLS